MDIPDLVQGALGDEEIQAGISLGDEDAVCVTPTRTLVYKGDGILSDEKLQEFSHDVERIAVSEGHRKTKFTLEYFDGTRSFTVPPNRDEKVLQLVLEGVLRVESVLEDRESVVDVYRFSELTLIVTEGRIIKLIGEPVWHDDYEVYPFEDVTGLEFERASVATSVVIEIDGRPQRVKVPNDTAPIVRQTIEKALFAYYDVSSLEELNRVVADDDGATTAQDHDEIDFGSGIDPLVTDDEDDVEPDGTLEDIATESADEGAATDAGTAAGAGSPNRQADAGGAPDESHDSGATDARSAGDDRPHESPTPDATAASDQPSEATAGNGATETREGEDSTAATDETDAAEGVEPAGREDLVVVADRLEELTEAVDRQNELLKRQHRAIEQLVEQLQSE